MKLCTDLQVSTERDVDDFAVSAHPVQQGRAVQAAVPGCFEPVCNNIIL